MNYDYAVHSDFLIHWTGKDIDIAHDKDWATTDKSKTKNNVTINDLYINRLYNILKYGLWMTEEAENPLVFDEISAPIPIIPKTCFTELKLSESRKHAIRYGRLGVGVKRPFIFTRYGRPMAYYGFNANLNKDKFLKKCAIELQDKKMLNFFKPMNSSNTLNYDFYAESEWRIIYFEKLINAKLIIDPRDPINTEHHNYFKSLQPSEQAKLKYLIPLDGWFAMIIYPSLDIKNIAQQDPAKGILAEVKRIKGLRDHGNNVEGGNRPIEVDLDACRNF